MSADIQHLREELKIWREAFVRENGGRQPTKEEVKALGLPLARTSFMRAGRDWRPAHDAHSLPTLACWFRRHAPA